uniref:SMP-30/Gluconolactonase/LRE-like region domain-containing protein n=1 Tax=Calcidiscus leptoporus TaxID=127549 RepID=A0A7S0JDR0_9EUKA|mmetsp:Transcript_50774/g.116938  ORF Transcript_50774/g.116938 Transcript_50774/m.116938 type:complete len:335 (+) Transcript_50774:82-1086(+)
MWLTTQKDGYVWLVDQHDDYRIMSVLKTPMLMGNETVSWPHSLCEAANGTIVVNLQGWTELNDMSKPVSNFSSAYAAWHVDPDAYDPDMYAHGGVLYEALPKPVNCAADGDGHVIVGQDASPSVLRISPDGTARQISVELHTTGPGVVAAPDGSVWIASIGSRNASLPETSGFAARFRRGSDVPELVRLGAPLANSRRIIHFAFRESPPTMYVLTSSLFHVPAVEEVLVFAFNEAWDSPDWVDTWPIGGYGDAHRIAYAPHDQSGRDSVILTEYGSDRLVQLSPDPPTFPTIPYMMPVSSEIWEMYLDMYSRMNVSGAVPDENITQDAGRPGIV